MDPLTLLVFTTIAVAFASDQERAAYFLAKQMRKRWKRGHSDAQIAKELRVPQQHVSSARIAEMKHMAEQGFNSAWIAREFGNIMAPESVERMIQVWRKQDYGALARMRRLASPHRENPRGGPIWAPY